MPSQSFRRILELLEQHDVAYVVVGGVAAVLQGAPVTTFDIGGLQIRVLNLRALIENKRVSAARRTRSCFAFWKRFCADRPDAANLRPTQNAYRTPRFQVVIPPNS